MTKYINDEKVKTMSELAHLETDRILNKVAKVIEITKPVASHDTIVLCSEHLNSKIGTMVQMRNVKGNITREDYEYIIAQHFMYYSAIIFCMNTGIEDYKTNETNSTIVKKIALVLFDQLTELEELYYKLMK